MASNDPQGNPYDAAQTPVPPRPGMSSTTKVILIVVACFGGLGLLCCGGLMATGLYFGNKVAKSFSQDPQVIQSVTKKLAEISIPESLKPTMSMDMQMFGVNMLSVAYTDKDSQSTLMLMSLAGGQGQANQQQMRQQMQQALRQQGVEADSDQAGNWESQTSTKPIKIRDEEVNFQFTHKTNKDNGQERIDVNGNFPGEEAPVILFLTADTKVLSEEQIVTMLESIK